MRFVYLLLALSLLSFSASANSEMTWEEIDASPALTAKFPFVSFGTVFVTANAVCREGEYLRTIKPVAPACTFEDHRSLQEQCLTEGPTFRYSPIVYVKKRCVSKPNMLSDEDYCRRWSEETVTTALTYDVPVYPRGGRQPLGDERPVLFTKSYTILDCEG